MNFLDIACERRDQLETEMRALLDHADTEHRELNNDEQARYQTMSDDLAAVVDRVADLTELTERARAAATVATTTSRDSGRRGPQTRGDQIRDAARYRVESNPFADPETRARLVDLVERDSSPHQSMASWAMAAANPAYVRAFDKYLRDPENFLIHLDDEERHAFSEARDYQRALAVGTNTQGGYLVPAHLDPTVILSNSGSASPLRSLARVETVAGPVWNGVSSAGVTASFDAELAEVSDDTPSVTRESVSLFTGRAFVGASIEAAADIQGLGETVAMLMADGRDNLESSKFSTGSGSAEPAGLWTRLDANTNCELTATTAATIGLVDLHATFRALPVRWRRRASWLMNPLFLASIQQLGTAVSASYTTNMADLPDRLITKPVFTDDAAPATQTTTLRDNEIVFGDFSQLLIADHVGGGLEFVPHIFGSNGRPLGERGWFYWWRTGSDVLVDTAFRLLQNKTSA